MNNNVLRFIAVIPGLAMLVNGLGFLVRPTETAASLHMDLLDGLGRSTQIGDMTSFFIGTALLIMLGAYKKQAHFLYAGALFIGLAAVARCIAALVHGADWAIQLIVAEVILTVWLCVSAYFMSKIRSE